MHSNLIELLQRPSSYPHPVDETIRVIETQVSWVFLTGTYAYKVKKVLDFGFLDFSTLGKRQFYCEEELRLNQRLAPDIYQAVIAIQKTSIDNHDTIVLGSQDYRDDNIKKDNIIEYAVRMQQFDPDAGLDNLLSLNQFQDHWIETLGDKLATFHKNLPIAATDSPWSKASNIWQLVSDNYLHCLNYCTDEIELEKLTRLYTLTTEQYASLNITFEDRKKLGFIRECHGDLHLGNVTFFQNEIQLFDCIEFNLQFRWIDTSSDLAFLLMDLEANNKTSWANRVLNRYLEVTGDYQSLQLLPFYKSFRAMVRAKVATLGAQANHEVFNHYLRLTQSYQQNIQPEIFLMHGLSGSGKSYLSHKMLETINAIRIRSETERHRIHKELQKKGKKLLLHSPEVNSRLSQHLLNLTEQIIKSGYTVIIDGTFLKQHFRQKYIDIATRFNSKFTLVSCHCNLKLMEARLKRNDNTRMTSLALALERLEIQQTYQQALSTTEKIYEQSVNTDSDDAINSFLEKIK